jgi:hypothetical protein
VSKIGSGHAYLLVDRGESPVDRVKRIHLDSLRQPEYRRKMVRQEVNGELRRFMNGFSNAEETIRDAVNIYGEKPEI